MAPLTSSRTEPVITVRIMGYIKSNITLQFISDAVVTSITLTRLSFNVIYDIKVILWHIWPSITDTNVLLILIYTNWCGERFVVKCRWNRKLICIYTAHILTTRSSFVFAFERVMDWNLFKLINIQYKINCSIDCSIYCRIYCSIYCSIYSQIVNSNMVDS